MRNKFFENAPRQCEWVLSLVVSEHAILDAHGAVILASRCGG